jgi:hypothetical protein
VIPQRSLLPLIFFVSINQGALMGRLIPEEITMDGKHDVNVNINVNVDADKINSLIWTACLASIARSWFRINKK